MKTSYAVVVAVLLAAMGSAVAIFAAQSEERTAAAQAPTDHGSSQRLAALERQVDELARQIETAARNDLPVPVRLPVDEGRAEGSPDSLESLRDIEQRLERLETLVRNAFVARDENAGELALDELMRRATSRDLERVDGDDPEDWREHIKALIQQTNETWTTPDEMISALRTLRGNHLEDGTDARLPVLPSMIELARTSVDGDVRADVWRQLSGVTAPELVAPLLDALAHDTDAGAREEAAETLADYLPDPAIEAALRYAMEHDEARNVQRQAERSLGNGR